jgi:hypothetical protein
MAESSTLYASVVALDSNINGCYESSQIMTIILVELFILLIYIAFWFPPSIPFDIARNAFEKIVDVDAALLGFTGVIVAVSIQTWTERFKYSVVVLGTVVILFVLSLLVCFRDLVLGNTVVSRDFYLALGFLIGGITMLFRRFGCNTI